MSSGSGEVEGAVASPRTTREQLQDVVDSYKQRLSNFKGQARNFFLYILCLLLMSPGVSHDGQPEPVVPPAYRH